ncbi:hypothetical protein WJX73_002186 [Symbiochloris irregularis]|uniref:UDP-N-acetylglucosamine transferase subunit ALG14 n=1 Tax=Symbiochloris irregularis TaxID=706552 RepID=A0AAW1NM23_9CHLO
MARTLIVLGSGGHTAEMLVLLSRMNPDTHGPRSYIVAATDAMSEKKAITAEQSRSETAPDKAFDVHRIPRSREVGQSYITSVWTTLVALYAAFALVWTLRPQLVLVNGPGTCIPICVATLALRMFARRKGKLVFVESIARVQTLSLSGKILYYLHMTDLFFVQWPVLQHRYPRTRYCGRLL